MIIFSTIGFLSGKLLFVELCINTIFPRMQQCFMDFPVRAYCPPHCFAKARLFSGIHIHVNSSYAPLPRKPKILYGYLQLVSWNIFVKNIFHVILNNFRY